MQRARLAVVGLLGLSLLAASVGAAAAARPVMRLTIIHTVRGCHVFMAKTPLGPSVKLRLKAGTRLEIRVQDPMDFDFVQTAGPRLALGPARTFRGSTRAIVFAKRAVYRLEARNVQTPEELGLETLGPTNLLRFLVVVV